MLQKPVLGGDPGIRLADGVIDGTFPGTASLDGCILRKLVSIVRTRLQEKFGGDELLHFPQGRRYPAGPEGSGAERSEVLGVVEVGIGDMVGLARVLQVSVKWVMIVTNDFLSDSCPEMVYRKSRMPC